MCKIVKTVIKQRTGVGNIIKVVAGQNDADQSNVISFCGGNQRIVRFIGITGLSGESTLIAIGRIILKQHHMMILKLTRGCSHIGRLNGIGQVRFNAEEGLVFDRFLHNQCHVVGSGIMIRIRQTVWIGKMRVRAAKCSGTFIHHISKRLHAAGDVDGKLCADLVGRGKKNGMERILHCDGFAELNINPGISRDRFADGLLSEGNRIGRLSVFGDKQCGHDFCDARRIALLVHVGIEKNRTGVGIHQTGCTGIGKGGLRPSNGSFLIRSGEKRLR